MEKTDKMYNIICFDICANGPVYYRDNKIIAKTTEESKEYIRARGYYYEEYNEFNMHLKPFKDFDVREEFFDNLRKFKDNTDILIDNVGYITNEFRVIKTPEEKYFWISIMIGDLRGQEVNMQMKINLETIEVQKENDFLKLLDDLKKSESTGMLIDTGKDVIEIAGNIN